MKKLQRNYFLYALIVVLVVAIVPLFVACDDTPHEHQWNEKITVEPQCDKEGSAILTCKICGEQKKAKVEALKHVYDEKNIEIVAAKCGVAGKEIKTCTICNKKFDTPIPALEHAWSTEKIEDREATQMQSGYQSYHCTREGCEGRKEIEIIPVKGEVKKAKYRFYFNRKSGLSLSPSATDKSKLPEVIITYPVGNPEAPDGKTETIKPESTSYRNVSGVTFIEKELPLDEYTFSFKKGTVPDGYEYEESYTINQYEEYGTYPYATEADYPTLRVTLASKPKPMATDGKLESGYKQGDIIRDFKIKTVDDEELTISGLLQEYKLIWFNFYYNDCGYCREEAPDMVRIYNKYKNDLAVICFNGKDPVSQIKSGATSIFKFPSTFYYVDDRSETNAVNKKFGTFRGYPTHVFIDRYGFIGEIFAGSTQASKFESIMKKYITDYPEDEIETAQIAPNLLSDVLRFPAAN